MTTYRPSAVVRLQIRLDEGADEGGLLGKLERGGVAGAAVFDSISAAPALGKTEALSANQAARRTVGKARDLLAVEDIRDATARLDEQRTRVQLGGAQQQVPQGLVPSSGDDLVLFGSIAPVECSIERNGILEADTAEVVLDWLDVPIDPRVIRAVFVEIVIGTVTGEEYEQGIAGARRADGSLMSMVERAEGQDRRAGSTTRFIGFVDEWLLEAKGSDGDVVRLRCRDLTAALASKRLPAGDGIDLDVPIAEGVQRLIDSYPSTRGLRVVFGNPPGPGARAEGGGAAVAGRGPVPGAAVPPSLRPRSGKAQRKRQGAKDLKLWDHVNDVVVATGFVPLLRGYTLYIAEPRTLYGGGGKGEALQLVYGRNLLDLTVARKMAADAAVPTVEVRCPDPVLGATRWARWPAPSKGPASGVFGKVNPPSKPSRASTVTPGGKPDEEIRTYLVSGVHDPRQLERVARSLFEVASRQEVEGSFETHDITGFGSEVEGDLLDMQPGDPVDVLIAPLNDASSGDATNTRGSGSVTSLQQLQEMSVAARAEWLRKIGYSRQTAQRLAAAHERAQLVSTFRAQTVNVDWSAADGLKITGDFINYIVVRLEKP